MSRTPEHHFDPYDWLAPFYDVMARALLLPFGGEARFRRRAIDTLEVRPGQAVLELGCGTGAMTEHLVAAGGRVTALDLSRPMMHKARRRVANATFREQDILSVEPEGVYDRALLAFVLHEMSAPIRRRALAAAVGALRPGGLLGVLDFAGDAPWPIDRVFRAYLSVAEPEMATELLDGSLQTELQEAGLTMIRRRHLARGTAQMLVGRKD